jgi:pantoate--beta-alanine ligase
MSSRNTYLNPQERRAALVLFKALNLAEKLYSQGERDAERLRQEMITLIQKEPLASIYYVSVANAETLDELETIDTSALASMAVRIGKTRLIDNVVLG